MAKHKNDTYNQLAVQEGQSRPSPVTPNEVIKV